jgi:hypothetical protein
VKIEYMPSDTLSARRVIHVGRACGMKAAVVGVAAR